jgi:mannosyltransferase
VIEAQRSGCPVIATNFSAIPEIAGSSALLIENISIGDFTDGLKTLLGDRSIRNTIIRKGLLNAKRFSWDKMYKETFDLYQELDKK